MGTEAKPDPPGAPIDCHRLELAACDAKDFAMLDPSERGRAARFKFERDRTRYIAAHAQTRRHLGARLNLAPVAVPLTTTANGKPVLDIEAALLAGAGPAAANLCFNLTHSGAVGYLAIASFSVGIDVELQRSLGDLQSLIDCYCSPAEVAALAAMPDAVRTMGFLGVWTRKEAALKAWGTGIGAIPLNELHVGTGTAGTAPLEMLGAGTAYRGNDDSPAGRPGLRLSTIHGAAEVLSIAAAVDGPLAIRMAASQR